jgi:spoIIIJ-associated protein
MIKIEAITLDEAYAKAALELDCSASELVVEVVQMPSSGILGMFRKKAIIVATKTTSAKEEPAKPEAEKPSAPMQKEEPTLEEVIEEVQEEVTQEVEEEVTQVKEEELKDVPSDFGSVPSFVSSQDEVEEIEDEEEVFHAVEDAVEEIKEDLQNLFSQICFDLDPVKVSAFDENTVYVEINGADAALLIGKEGYRYKALSYMIFNWINAKYGFQLRLEIAEFLHNQEEAVNRYLESVKENVDRDGRAQTKILDGVLVQIALRELRATYPDKYVAIRTTRDGLKYIIINDYNY